MRRLFFAVSVVALAVAGCGQAETGMPTGLEEQVTQETPQALNQRAMELLSQGQIPASVQAFQQAIMQFPDDPEAYFSLAQVYMKVGSFDNAIMVCQKLIERKPDNGQAYLFMAGCFDLKNEPQKAIELVKMSMALFEKQGDAKSLEAANAILQKLSADPAGSAK